MKQFDVLLETNIHLYIPVRYLDEIKDTIGVTLPDILLCVEHMIISNLHSYNLLLKYSASNDVKCLGGSYYIDETFENKTTTTVTLLRNNVKLFDHVARKQIQTTLDFDSIESKYLYLVQQHSISMSDLDTFCKLYGWSVQVFFGKFGCESSIILTSFVELETTIRNIISQFVSHVIHDDLALMSVDKIITINEAKRILSKYPHDVIEYVFDCKNACKDIHMFEFGHIGMYETCNKPYIDDQLRRYAFEGVMYNNIDDMDDFYEISDALDTLLLTGELDENLIHRQ